MYKVIAIPKINNELRPPLFSWHKTREEAEDSRNSCLGKFPYGNRVKIIAEEASNVA